MSELHDALLNIYKNRENFILIGLTGRTGSGCTSVAGYLKKSFEDISPPTPQSGSFDENEERKYRIIYDYAKINWRKYHCIQVRDVIADFILEMDYDVFRNYVVDYVVKLTTALHGPVYEKTLDDNVKSKYIEIFNKRNYVYKLPESNDEEAKIRHDEIYKYYFNMLPEFTNNLKKVLDDLGSKSYTPIFQTVGDNIRSSGNAFSEVFDPTKFFTLAERINLLVKLIHKLGHTNNTETFIVLDAIRNPYEASYFKERYSSFYLMSIKITDNERRKRLQGLNFTYDQINKLDEKEYPSKLSGKNKFISQDIQRCIQLSDIHVNNTNETLLKRQLIWYISLIMHPGLVTPCNIERCMQIAYSAKINSGCISRQVGAVLTDKDYSIKSVGWNSPPHGHVPCILRNVEDMINKEDVVAYSDYEKNNDKFRQSTKDIYSKKIKDSNVKDKLRGQHISYCFKDLQNNMEQEKNQVYTRALHAEENAFIQITKYGGVGLNGGKLFSTASPCELCAKKAYQIGIEEIIYVDPYPGIAIEHIILCGEKQPKLKLFYGAIGRAYNQLYEPIAPYKEEMEIILDIKYPKKYIGMKS